jgi:murein DD-endopeptidase MepM/ murein hydrolase activator NlpD
MSQFIFPTTVHTIADGFHARGGEHQGIDLQCADGSPVFASAPGTVLFAGSSGGYGFLIRLIHDNGYETRYGHLSKFLVHKGDYVTQGHEIALSGGRKGAIGSGDSTGPHLHFEIRYNGVAYDPLSYLNAGGSPSQGKVKKMFGFVRNPAGEISIVNPVTGRKRGLTLPEWSAYSANGASYAQLSDADYNGSPNE